LCFEEVKVVSEKIYAGNRPSAQGWELAGKIEADVCWLVFVKQAEGSSWLQAKVVADGYATSKANYWLGWNGARFSQKRDTEMLAEYRPELLHKVERMLEGYSLL
jgi:hypothetical protein